MKKLKIEEMKNIKGGAPAALVECICAFMDVGWGFDQAYDYCHHVLEL